jgi:hypothetical protein
VIVLSESSAQLTPSPSAQDLKKMTEAASLSGCRVYYIPQDFSQCETAENALAHIPNQDAPTPAVWIGYIPSPERYASIHDAARAKNIVLLNDLDQHLTAQEFDRAYALLHGLTPRSVVLTDSGQCANAIEILGLPLFVKGAVQSRKALGWSACVAQTPEELNDLCSRLLSLENRSRGRVLIRELVKLRHARVSGTGLPFGREYRVFLYRAEALGFGYYWNGDDPLKPLTRSEQNEVLALAREAARRVGTPYLAVDIGQIEDGRWIVIETGDPQFSGVSQIPILALWSALSQIG